MERKTDPLLLPVSAKSDVPISLRDLVPASAHIFLRILLKLFLVVTRYSRRLLPSFLRRDGNKEGPANSVAWLNGVRGFASLFVFLHHFQYPYHDEGWSGTGFNGGPPGHEHENRWITQLPFIRLIHAGSTMVTAFFIVSGFSLSIKPVRLIREQAWQPLLLSLSSSTWRRAGRLYIPCLAVTLFTVLGLQIGLYDFTARFLATKTSLPVWLDPQANKQPSLYLQLVEWFYCMYDWATPFPFSDKGAYVIYNIYLWTIPVEFRCSLLLFVTILGLARTALRFRLGLEVGLVLYCVSRGDWEMSLFYVGLVLAEADAIRRSAPGSDLLAPLLPIPGSFIPRQLPLSMSRRFLKFFSYFLFIVGLYLMSAPDVWYETAPGYATLESLVPATIRDRARWVPMVGCIIFVTTVSCFRRFQRLFDNPFALWLGRISFPLYLIQHPLNHILGYRIVLPMIESIGRQDHFHKEIGFLIGSALYLPIALWIADLLVEFLDEQTVDIMRRLEGWTRVEAKKRTEPGLEGGVVQRP